MWPFRRKKREIRKNPRPAWFGWLVLAFLAYALVLAGKPDTPANPNPIRHALNKAGDDIKKQPMLNLDGYKNVIFPDEPSNLAIMEVEEGKGKPAVCGQRVEVTYQAYLAQGNELSDKATADKPLRFTIGEHNAMPAFELGVIGMKTGGKRSVLAPPLLSYGLDKYKRDDVPQGANVRFEMELLSATPDMPDANGAPYRLAEVATGDGAYVSCGTEVNALVTIWDARGKELYKHDDKQHPLTFIPGKSQVMMGLDQGAIGMRAGGIRFLVIPPAFQKTMQGNAPKLTFPVPDSEVLLVELTAL